MAKQNSTVQKEARHGEKMIEIRIRFWTNKLAPQGKIKPKHAWTSGVVFVEPNSSHGIKPGNPKPFNSLLDVGGVMEKVLIQHGVVLHPGRRMKKYVRDARRR